VDFWRKPPPLIGFGVERHTLALRRYHPGISPSYLEVSSIVCTASQRTMSQSLAQVVDRLAMVDISSTQAPHAAQGNSGADSRPQSPTRTYTFASRIPRPLFPCFQRAPPEATEIPIAQRPPTHAEYRREYAAMGCDFHQDMTLVEYCGLRLRNCPRDPQRGGPQQQ
jgi:hypothetical protein